ncbi:MAG: E3 binding domain-containing protein, partial [Candidatus Dormibacteraeota bacterium]|nr:E3 binding domain-containing protein [Candidatus Dormibacteraeota bacterium]
MPTTKVTMPQLGESVHEGTISKWLVKPGDKLVEFEPMLEVDTDKVNAEVPAPVTGVLKEILAQEGATVQAGSEIAIVELEGEGNGAAAPEKVEATAAAADEPAGGGDAMPSAEQARAADAQPRPSPQAAPQAQAPAEAAETPAEAAEAPAAAERDSQVHRFSPGVLMLAEESGVDLARIKGTGLGGRVTKRDVRQFVEGQSGAAPAPAESAPA